MNSRPDTYYPQPPQMPMQPMPRPPIAHRHARTWRDRLMRHWGIGMFTPVGKGELTLPEWMVGKSVLFFFIALGLCTLALGHPVESQFVLIAGISVLIFLYGGRAMLRLWSHASGKIFKSNVFKVSLAVHLLWVFYCYFIMNPDYYGTVYGATADVTWYMPFAKDLAVWLAGDSTMTLSEILQYNGAAIDDTGYPMWLAVEYLLAFETSDVFFPMIIKAIVSSYCAILIYNVAKRHFGEGTARIAALFVALNPNMIYWNGCMFKESEMVFLCCLFVDKMDMALTSGKLSLKTLFPGMLAGMALFFFRGALGLVAFLAVLAHVIFVSRKVLSTGKKVLAGVLVGVTLLVGMGDRIRTNAERVQKAINSNEQQGNMEWRSKRQGGNTYAQYAGAIVFAPLIFTIPFPTFNVANDSQILQRMLSGGSYIKNILSFFVLLVMLLMLISGEWRRHVFILAYTCGYLACLVLSNFAQSGRFHMPVLPMLMLFAAYGVQIAKVNPKIRKWFPLVLVLEVVACLAWNWFKLKGRGMI